MFLVSIHNFARDYERLTKNFTIIIWKYPCRPYTYMESTDSMIAILHTINHGSETDRRLVVAGEDRPQEMCSLLNTLRVAYRHIQYFYLPCFNQDQCVFFGKCIATMYFLAATRYIKHIHSITGPKMKYPTCPVFQNLVFPTHF